MKNPISNQIGAFEAKTHFSQLLKRVENGEKITILKHNSPIAIISPAAKKPKRDIQEAIDEMRAFSKGNRLDGLSIKELINYGRR